MSKSRMSERIRLQMALGEFWRYTPPQPKQFFETWSWHEGDRYAQIVNYDSLPEEVQSGCKVWSSWGHKLFSSVNGAMEWTTEKLLERIEDGK